MCDRRVLPYSANAVHWRVLSQPLRQNTLRRTNKSTPPWLSGDHSLAPANPSPWSILSPKMRVATELAPSRQNGRARPRRIPAVFLPYSNDKSHSVAENDRRDKIRRQHPRRRAAGCRQAIHYSRRSLPNAAAVIFVATKHVFQRRRHGTIFRFDFATKMAHSRKPTRHRP